jgi:membrane-associated phospholipid phosphatase
VTGHQRFRNRSNMTSHLKPRTSRTFLLLSAASLLLVFALHFWLVWVGSFPGDRWAAAQSTAIFSRPKWLQDTVRDYGDLGSPGLATAIVLALGLWLWWVAGRRAATALLIACLAVALNALLKTIFGPTPFAVQLYRSGSNFPSGHVAFVTATVGFAGLVAVKYRQWWLVAVAVVLVGGIGPARVISGAHVVSDVIGGYLMGAAGVLLACAYLARPASPGSVALRTSREALRRWQKPGRRL